MIKRRRSKLPKAPDSHRRSSKQSARWKAMPPLPILQESEAEAITAVTHDGTDGQLTSTKGALTFRTGDIFSGKETEQMRLTEDGRLGIGTGEPRATLDVAGTIRAERYLVAK